MKIAAASPAPTALIPRQN